MALWERQPGALIPHNRFISQTVEALMRLTPQLALPSERCQELGNDDAPRWRGPRISTYTDMKHRPANTHTHTRTCHQTRIHTQSDTPLEVGRQKHTHTHHTEHPIKHSSQCSPSHCLISILFWSDKGSV